MINTTRALLLSVCPLLLVAMNGCASGDPASADSASKGETRTVALGAASSSRADADEVVTLDECPAAVQATIEAHLDGGRIVEIERTADHGEVLYEVDVRGAGGVVEFDVAADGAFRGYEADDDDGAQDEGDDDGDDEDGHGDDEENEVEIPLSEVPDLVKDAAIAAVPGLVLEEAVLEHEGDVVVYELEGEADGKEYEIEVSAAGEVLEIEIDDDDDDDGDDD